MRHPAALLDRELGRADVHATVELHGVGVHDLRGNAARSKGVSEVKRETGLAGSGCADNGDEHRGQRWPSCRS